MGVTEVISKFEQGARLSKDDTRLLYSSADLLTLGRLGTQRRQKDNPGRVVTYLIDRNINYTNVCNSDCSFCGFYRHDPKHPESYVLSKKEIGSKIEEALALGATRILFQGGHNDELPYSFYTDIVQWIKSSYPKIEINAFSPSEVQQMRKISGKSYHQILSELKECGLAGLPGGGGEILDDEIRSRVSPKKIKADEWIEVMEVAHGLDLTTSSTMIIGFGETIEHRLNHLERLRNLQDRSRKKGLRGFTSFISWTLQLNEATSMGRSKHRPLYGESSIEYLRMVAISRIFLDNIPHHQASWPTLGADVGMMALHFGCDDMGSTMMEENVVSKAGALTQTKWSMSPEELQGHIRDAGFEPAQRDSAFSR